MGNCTFCGKSAGWFRSEHAECRQANDAEMAAKAEAENKRLAALDELGRTLIKQVCDGVPLTTLHDAVEGAAQSGVLTAADRTPVLAKAWAGAVDAFLEDGLLSAEEEERITKVMQAWMLAPADLESTGALWRAGKAAVLRGVMEGKPTFTEKTDVPVNIGKNEGIAWVFHNVDYLEDVTKREMVGGSQGVSIRVMSGLYYRVGAFKAKPVYSTSRKKLDAGALVVTDKHLYFVGATTSKKIPYSKIVSFEQFSNGIGLMRDAATAKPQIFVVDDGWFAYNLITNLARLAA